MNVLIIEDEKPAADRLGKLILAHNAEIRILAKLDSVKSAVRWFSDASAQPDLIFMDIQLADGLSFEIFEYINIKSPVVFTTAYDEYALKAFKVNSIDYILKPVDSEELEAAFLKLERLQGPSEGSHALEQINQAMAMLTNKYKNRFVVKIGEHLKSIAVDDILYFFSRDKATYCCVGEGKNYLLDYSLEQVEGMMDPAVFYRINRKYLIALRAVQDIISYSSSRLKLVLKYGADDDAIVSRERVSDFKSWLDS